MLFAHWQSNTDLQICRVSCAAINLAVAGCAVSLVTAGQRLVGTLAGVQRTEQRQRMGWSIKLIQTLDRARDPEVCWIHLGSDHNKNLCSWTVLTRTLSKEHCGNLNHTRGMDETETSWVCGIVLMEGPSSVKVLQNAVLLRNQQGRSSGAYTFLTAQWEGWFLHLGDRSGIQSTKGLWVELKALLCWFY